MNKIGENNEIEFEKIKKNHFGKYFIEIRDKLTPLTSASPNIRSDDEAVLYKIILDNLEDILVGSTDKLSSIIVKIDNHIARKNQTFRQNNIFNNLKNSLTGIFNYDNFRDSYLPNWGAYLFVKELKISTCSYCNRNYTFTYDRQDEIRQIKNGGFNKSKIRIKDVSGKTRPELDHFYPRSKYPYLGLSLFNLIPCCHICNSGFKGDTDISYNTHLNPYSHSFHDILRFNVRLKTKVEIQNEITIGHLLGKVEDYFGYEIFNSDEESFVIELLNRNSVLPEDIDRANGNNELFALTPLYNLHKDYVVELIKKAKIYGKDGILDIYQKHPNLWQSENDCYRSLLGNYITKDEIHKRPLSKLTIDISSQFGII